MLSNLKETLSDKWLWLLSFIKPQDLRHKVTVSGEDDPGIEIDDSEDHIRKPHRHCVKYRPYAIDWTLLGLERTKSGVVVYVLNDPETNLNIRISSAMFKAMFYKVSD